MPAQMSKNIYLQRIKRLTLSVNRRSALCHITHDFKEFGVYNVTLNANRTCEVVSDKDGVDIYMPILSVFIIILVCSVLAKLFSCTIRKYWGSSTGESTVGQEANPEAVKKRMRSLDTFRGISIVLMIFVNSGGGKYWWVEHATWNGLHIADLVFPSFLWIMGVCIPISIKSQMSRGAGKLIICRRILWRSIKLFLIGLCLNSINGPNLSDLRIMGVLQRFGIAYLICGVAHTVFHQGNTLIPQPRIERALNDLILLKGELLILLALVAIDLGIVFGVPAPGCPKGYMGPAGKTLNPKQAHCIGGIVGYIDKKVLGNNHIYQHPTARYMYDSSGFDPEGLFGCIFTVVQVLFGMICGQIILTFPVWKDRVKRWMYWSVALGLIGGLLCMFSREGGIIPINKNLWSLSFVLVTSSLAFLLLTVLYLIIDIRNIWSGFPFEECGKNAITMYIGHMVFHRMLPWHWRIGQMNTHFVLLLEAVWNTSLWVMIAVYLDSKKLYYSL
ncbi:HGSNAT family protein [Megaselia abdita]